jgi:hypothetical protein
LSGGLTAPRERAGRGDGHGNDNGYTGDSAPEGQVPHAAVFSTAVALILRWDDRIVSGYLAVAVAAVFIWLGMVLAISFLEAPLKFRAPGVTIPLGLGIGRLVFRALNICEVVLAAVAAGAVFLGRPSSTAMVALLVAVVALGAQMLGVRPALTRRADAVLADAAVAESGRSHAHFVYVGLEIVKVVALLVTGVLLLGP